MSNNNNEIIKRHSRRSVFLSSERISIGESKIDINNMIFFRPHGSFGKLVPTLGDKDNIKFRHLKLKEYNPKDGEDTGTYIDVYFFDLYNQSLFNFGSNIPKELEFQFKTLKTENERMYGQIEYLLNLLQVNSFDEARTMTAFKDVETARKLVNTYNSGSNTSNLNKINQKQ